MIFLRGKASYLYSTVVTTQDREGNQENAQASSRMTPIASGKFPVPERVSGKVFQRLSKPQQTLRVSLTRVCGIRTLYSGFGNRVQTQQSHLGQRFVASHSVQNLVISLGSVQIIQWVM